MPPQNKSIFLVSDRVETLQLQADRLCRLGRDPGCDLVLQSRTVSRLHATILFDDDQFIVQDQNSRNGISINDRPVESAVLHHGDKLTIGEFEFLVMQVDTQKKMADLLQCHSPSNLATLDMEVHADPGRERHFSGDLESVSCAELVQMLHVNAKTGRLMLYDAQGATMGALEFLDGRLLHAKTPEHHGEIAAIQLVQIQRGRFTFVADTKLVPPSITKPTLWIVFEALKCLDERSAPSLLASEKVRGHGGTPGPGGHNGSPSDHQDRVKGN